MKFVPASEILMCVHEQYNVFCDQGLDQVIHQWIKVGGSVVEGGENRLKLFQHGVEVGFITQTTVWSKI